MEEVTDTKDRDNNLLDNYEDDNLNKNVTNDDVISSDDIVNNRNLPVGNSVESVDTSEVLISEAVDTSEVVTSEAVTASSSDNNLIPDLKLTNVTSSEADTQQSCDNQVQNQDQKEDASSPISINEAYHVKWIRFSGSLCGVVTQNSNGPCPLISIINVLSLRGKLNLPQGCEVISGEQLLEYLADLLINMEPDSRNSEQDFHHNMNDAIAILPKLQTGLDVNVKFSGVRDFEYTPECIIFDLVGIGLYHGWLVDPQLEDLVLAIGNKSYNQVVEFIISGRSSDNTELMAKAILADQFLEDSASQLTYHGICELNSVMKEGQLAVFFRNNHFSTMCKQGDTLYLLVTDQGFLDQADVVWETLDSVQGDTVFIDQQFNVIQNQGISSEATEGDTDHALAMSLQRQDIEASKRDQEWQEFKQKHLGGNQEQLSDEELARRLQEVENSAPSSSPQASASPPVNPEHPIGPRNNRDKKCIIL